MSKAGVKFSEIKDLLMKDEEFKSEYEKLKPRYDVISQNARGIGAEGGYSKIKHIPTWERNI